MNPREHHEIELEQREYRKRNSTGLPRLPPGLAASQGTDRTHNNFTIPRGHKLSNRAETKEGQGKGPFEDTPVLRRPQEHCSPSPGGPSDWPTRYVRHVGYVYTGDTHTQAARRPGLPGESMVKEAPKEAPGSQDPEEAPRRSSKRSFHRSLQRSIIQALL